MPQDPEATSKTKRVKTKQISNVENVQKENCIVPMYPDSETEDKPPSNLQPLSQNSTQNVVNNQLQQAANLFQNANFNNCNFTFTLPQW